MAIENANDDEAPLDPAAERLRRKMLGLLGVSIGFMMISLIVVLGVIVYRVMGPSVPEYDGSPIRVDLPAGAMITETSLDGDQILLRVTGPQGEELVLVSTSDGQVLRRFTLGAPAME